MQLAAAVKRAIAAAASGSGTRPGREARRLCSAECGRQVPVPGGAARAAAWGGRAGRAGQCGLPQRAQRTHRLPLPLVNAKRRVQGADKHLPCCVDGVEALRCRMHDPRALGNCAGAPRIDVGVRNGWASWRSGTAMLGCSTCDGLVRYPRGLARCLAWRGGRRAVPRSFFTSILICFDSLDRSCRAVSDVELTCE